MPLLDERCLAQGLEKVMTDGKGRDVNRAYEEFCRDVLRKNDDQLVPVDGDGVGVAFDAAGSRWTFDVALHVPNVRLVVAECRRRTAVVKQEDLAAFAFRVDRLQRALGLSVAGVFFAKSRFQIGAVRVAQSEGIAMAIVGDGEVIDQGFGVEYHRYDVALRKRVRDITLHVAPGAYSVAGGVARTVRR